MSEKLPFFKFYPSEWLEGNIFDENDQTQALFVRICAYYWKKDCQLDLKFISKRLINGKASLKHCLEKLIATNILKVDDNQFVRITFLNDQFTELSEKRKKLADAGRIGGKASVKHRLSYIDIDKYKEEDLYNSVLSHDGKKITASQRKQLMERFMEIAEEYPFLLTIKSPLTPQQYFKLCEKHGRDLVLNMVPGNVPVL